MNNEEFEQKLFILNWDNTESANKIGISRTSLIKYLKPDTKIPRWLEKFLDMYIELEKLKHSKVKGTKKVK
ncbi:MAG: hypothetical protein WC055_00115 [Melioribacteraceae bacterium]